MAVTVESPQSCWGLIVERFSGATQGEQLRMWNFVASSLLLSCFCRVFGVFCSVFCLFCVCFVCVLCVICCIVLCFSCVFSCVMCFTWYVFHVFYVFLYFDCYVRYELGSPTAMVESVGGRR